MFLSPCFVFPPGRGCPPVFHIYIHTYIYIYIYTHIIQQSVQCVHIFLRPFIDYIIFFLQMCLSFQSSSTNPFSPISPLIPSTQVNSGLPRFLTLHYVYIIYNYMIYKYNDTEEGTKSTRVLGTLLYEAINQERQGEMVWTS